MGKGTSWKIKIMRRIDGQENIRYRVYDIIWDCADPIIRHTVYEALLHPIRRGRRDAPLRAFDNQIIS